MGAGGPRDDQVRTHAVDVEVGAQRSDAGQVHVAQRDLPDQRTGPGQAVAQIAVGLRPPRREGAGIGLVGQAAPHDLHPHLRITRRRDVDGQAETVEQLRAQLALLRVHGPHQHEGRFLHMGHPVALHGDPARGGGVEKHVHQMIREQIDLVDVEHSPIGARQQARAELRMTGRQHRLHVDGTDHPILRRPQRQIDHRPLGQQRPQGTHGGGLRGALLPAHHHTADARRNGGQQQRETEAVLAHDGRKRETRKGRHAVIHTLRRKAVGGGPP